MNPVEHCTIRPRGRPKAFTDADAARIVRMYNAGERVLAIAAEFGVHKATVYSVLHKHKAPPAEDGATGLGDRQPHDTPGGAA